MTCLCFLFYNGFMAGIEDAIEGYTLVARPSKKGINPPHLQPHQDRLAKAAKEAADETKHLKGVVRVMRMNELVRQKLREEA